MKTTSIKLSDSQIKYLQQKCKELSDEDYTMKISTYIRFLIKIDKEYNVFQQYYQGILGNTQKIQNNSYVNQSNTKKIQNNTGNYDLDKLLNECYGV